MIICHRFDVLKFYSHKFAKFCTEFRIKYTVSTFFSPQGNAPFPSGEKYVLIVCVIPN